MLLFTTHAEEQMGARNISREIVIHTIENAQQRLDGDKGRQIFQSQYFDEIEQKEMLLRVIAEPEDDDLIVVSVYKTSRFRKYWLGDGRHENNL